MKTYKERTDDILAKAEINKRKNSKIVKLCSIAASVLAVVLAFNLVLFVPYETGGANISKYANSGYYPVIKQLTPLTYGEPEKTNNFKEWFGNFNFGISDKGDAMPPPAYSPATGDEAANNGQYNEVTNNQTVGVTEGDLFKRSDKYIYYLNFTPEIYDVIIDEADYSKVEVHEKSTYVLKVYSIAGAASEQVAEYKIIPDEDETFRGYVSEREMFLSNDCKTVTILTPSYNAKTGILYTALISIDVSDTENITETNRVYVSGSYVSSRVVGDTLLLVSDFSVRRCPDFSDEAQYLPQIGKDGSFESLPLEDIIRPENANSASYTVICSIDAYTLEVNDSIAFLSYSDEVYVSAENMFVWRAYTVTTVTDNEYQLSYMHQVSEIYCVGYKGETLEAKGSVVIEGRIPDRYCMDDYDGVLRVFTNAGFYGSYVYNGKDPYEGIMHGDNVCNLYCVDLSTFEIIASAERFAPLGESVRSARFYGNTAYVCTAEEVYNQFEIIIINDPVFAFDLSDYSNITYKDTGTIPGYSLSLTAFKDDTLLGIGYGEFRDTLKIELYRETHSSVESVAVYESENTQFSPQFKAYFIDAENGLIGLGTGGTDFVRYTVLRYDGYNLNVIATVKCDNLYDYQRATYIDGYLYVFGYETFSVIPLS